jgi:hypothetical protein
LIGDKGAIELKMSECCVCFNTTYTKTGCDHHVCISCISEIEKVFNNEGRASVNCPKCSEEISSTGFVSYDW